MIPSCILAVEDDDDRAYMSSLYLNYNRLMYNQIFKIVHDEPTTDDLLQDVLVKLIDRVSELRMKDRNHQVNYIISACKNHAFNYLRNQKARAEVPIDELFEIPDPHQSQSEMEALLITKEGLSQLACVWPKLDDRSRYILESYYIMEKSATEIGLELGIKPDSVRMALTRARKAAFYLIEKD